MCTSSLLLTLTSIMEATNGGRGQIGPDGLGQEVIGVWKMFVMEATLRVHLIKVAQKAPGLAEAISIFA